MDQGIGRIVQTLKTNGQFDNTLILFMQDNGGNFEAIGRQGHETRPPQPTLPKIGPEHVNLSGKPNQTRDGYPVLSGTGIMPGTPDTFIAYGKSWANVSNTPFREYKHFVHEGGIATPLIAHWPAGIHRKNELEKQPGHLIDIMATCVDLAGATYPKEFAGKPITPLEGQSLRGAFDGNPILRDAIYWEHEGNRAVRQGDWKLVAKAPQGAWELYNMAVDRTEMHDLATSEPQRVADLTAKWEAWGKRANALPWPWKPAYGSKGSPAQPGEGKPLVLKAGADWDKDDAPNIKGKAITIHATITKMVSDGVIVAHGGTTVGYSLYFKEGKLCFATRHGGKRRVIETKEALPADTTRIGATLARDGTVTLTAGDQTVATGKVPGPMERQPTDGLQVGQEKNAAVGDYTAPFPFKGEIGEVTIQIDGK
jgi:arylsulfatase